MKATCPVRRSYRFVDFTNEANEMYRRLFSASPRCDSNLITANVCASLGLSCTPNESTLSYNSILLVTSSCRKVFSTCFLGNSRPQSCSLGGAPARVGRPARHGCRPHTGSAYPPGAMSSDMPSRRHDPSFFFSLCNADSFRVSSLITAGEWRQSASGLSIMRLNCERKMWHSHTDQRVGQRILGKITDC